MREMQSISNIFAVWDDNEDMSIWPEDFSKNTLDEIVCLQAENIASSKFVRLRAKANVKSRLAGQISREEYAIGRKATVEDSAECKRRRTILIAELTGRGYQC